MVSTVHVDLGENLAGIGNDENFAMPFLESMKHNVSQLFVLKSFLEFLV